MTEDFETQAVAVQLAAGELSKLPQVSNQEENCKTGLVAEAAVEQLAVEEKNISQARWETYNDDSSEDEDFTPAVEERSTQTENKLQYMKIDEVSWTKIKFYFTEQRPIHCLAFLDS